MTMKNIQDQVQNLCLFIALESYSLGIRHDEEKGMDEIKDELLEIIKKNMEGK